MADQFPLLTRCVSRRPGPRGRVAGAALVARPRRIQSSLRRELHPCRDGRPVQLRLPADKKHDPAGERLDWSMRAAAGHRRRTPPIPLFPGNAAWLELALLAHDILVWMQLLTLDGEHAVCEPKRLRYRILHVAGQISRHAPPRGATQACALRAPSRRRSGRRTSRAREPSACSGGSARRARTRRSRRGPAA